MKNLYLSITLIIMSCNIFAQEKQEQTSEIYIDELIDEKLLSINIYDFCGNEEFIDKVYNFNINIGESYVVNLETLDKLKSSECQSVLDYAIKWNEKALNSFPFLKRRKPTEKEDGMKNIHDMNQLIESFRISISALRLKYQYEFLKNSTDLI